MELRFEALTARLGAMSCVSGSRLAERGASLLEAAFTIALFGSTIALANAILSEEVARQRDVLLGRDVRIMTQAAQSYAMDEHGNLRDELASLSAGAAIMTVDIQRISEAGHLPAILAAGGIRRNSFGQGWHLLVRGVDRSDAERPAPTLTVAEIDSDGNGAVDAELVDGNDANGELDLEIILATSGGEAIPARNGNPAIVASGLPIAGFVQEEGVASGPYGNWEMDISAFSALDGHPGAGRFASLIALSGYGVLEFGGAGAGQVIRNPLDRCPGASGDLLDDCADDNQMHTDIVFNSPNGNGQAGSRESAAIRNLYGLEMGPPVDSDADGTPDIFAAISGANSIGCDGTAPAGLLAGTLVIDCPNTKVTGSVDVEGDMSANGSATASGFFATSIGGQNLVKGIYSAHLVALDPEPEIDKPECAAAAGIPAIYALPVSFVSPDGAPLVGVQAFAEELSGDGDWTVRMKAAVDRDSDGDGVADVVDLESPSDFVLALTKCE